jgi:hypothetical protein
MEQAQIHAGFLGPNAVNGCIAGLLVVGHIASLLQRRSAYEWDGALCTRALPGVRWVVHRARWLTAKATTRSTLLA